MVAAQDGSDGRNLTGRKMRSIKSSLVVGAGGARPMRGRLAHPTRGPPGGDGTAEVMRQTAEECTAGDETRVAQGRMACCPLRPGAPPAPRRVSMDWQLHSKRASGCCPTHWADASGSSS